MGGLEEGVGEWQPVMSVRDDCVVQDWRRVLASGSLGEDGGIKACELELQLGQGCAIQISAQFSKDADGSITLLGRTEVHHLTLHHLTALSHSLHHLTASLTAYPTLHRSLHLLLHHPTASLHVSLHLSLHISLHLSLPHLTASRTAQVRHLWEDVLSGPMWLLIAGDLFTNEAAKDHMGDKSRLDRHTDIVAAASKDTKAQLSSAIHGEFGEVDLELASKPGEMMLVNVSANPPPAEGGVLLDGSMSYIMALDERCNVLRYNALVKTDLIGEDNTEESWPVLNQPLEQFCWEPDLSMVKQAVEKALEGERVEFAKVMVYSVDGGLALTCRGTAHPFYDQDAKVRGTMLEFSDMTADCFDMDAQDALMKSNLLAPAWAMDPNGNLIAANGQAELLIPNGLMTPFRDLITGSDSKAKLDLAMSSALSGINSIAKIKIKDPETGKDRSLDVELAPQIDAHGHVSGVVVMEQPPAAFVVNEEGIIVECSEEAASMIGLDRGDVIEQEFIKLIQENSKAKAFDMLMQGLEDPSAMSDTDVRINTIDEEGKVKTLDAKMQVSGRAMAEGQGLMVLLEPQRDKNMPFKAKRKKKKKSGPHSGHKEAVSLRHGSMVEGSRNPFSKFQVENVDLQKQQMGGLWMPLLVCVL